MAKVIMTNQLPLNEVIDIIKKSYPTYICTINGTKINIDTGVQGKMEIYYIGKSLIVVPKINVILAFILGLTVILGILLIIAIQLNPLAKEIANTIANNGKNLQSELNVVELISEICPHCKNPNANRSTTCEWCGNQIV
jgi:hypothetical protein